MIFTLLVEGSADNLEKFWEIQVNTQGQHRLTTSELILCLAVEQIDSQTRPWWTKFGSRRRFSFCLTTQTCGNFRPVGPQTIHV